MIDPKKIWGSSQLPSLPTVAIRLLEIARNPDAEIQEVIDATKLDPAISAKLLKAANSSQFAIATQVKTIDRAVLMLGKTVATSLGLSFSLTDSAMNGGPLVEHYRRYWVQSVVQGAVAEKIGRQTSAEMASEYLLGGLLLDLGRLAMLKTIPREYLPVLEAAKAGQPLVDAEQQRLGFDHAFIGSQLMTNWKLPKELAAAVRLHHATPATIAEHQADPSFPLILTLAVASAVGEYYCENTKGESLALTRELLGRYRGFTEADVDQFLASLDESVRETGQMMQVDLSDLGDPADLMAEASEQLAQLAVREHVAGTQESIRRQVVEEEKRKLETENQSLQNQALRDKLTGLYNRHFFDEALDTETSRAASRAAPVGVIFADVDHFKKFNDTYGHAFGDIVLARVAQVCAKSIRSSDVLARYGGEEFVFLISQPSEKGIEKLADRIRERVAAERIEFEGTAVSVTVSLGTALTIPGRDEAEVGKKLLEAADAALYESKHAGRNRVTGRVLCDDQERELLNAVTLHRFSRWLVNKQIIDVPSASRAILECVPQATKIGELAVNLGYLTEDQVCEILDIQATSNERFGQIAVHRGYLTRDELVHLLTLQQESPKALAATVIRMGLVPPDRVVAALEDYYATQVPSRRQAVAN